MNPLNPFAISGMLIVILYLPLLVLLFKNSKTQLIRIYSLHILSVIIWGCGSFLIGTIRDIQILKVIWGIAYTAVLFIPIFLYHAVLIITKNNKRWGLILCYSQGIILITIITIDVLLTQNNNFFLFYSMYFHKNTVPFFFSFIAWVTISIITHVELYKHYKISKDNKEKHQTINLLWAFTGFLGGATNFLPAFGVNFYPYGNFLVPLHSFFITYAIFQHSLFNIKVVLRRGMVYSALILFVSLLYFSIVLICEKFIQGFWGYKSMSISVVAAFTIGIIFFPLHSYIQRIVDKFIFKKTTEEISQENELLRAEVIETEKLKSVAILASGMAHEIKNPLTALKTFSEYLPNKLDDKEFLQKFSRIVGGEVKRIDELVNELLEFAKPAPIQLKETNPNKLITDTLDFLSSKFLQHKIVIKTDLSPDCDKAILLDQNKIRQAMLNILLNAIDAMKSGGNLSVHTIARSEATKQTQIAASPQEAPRNGMIFISITDTGTGISKEHLNHIFDPFFSTKDAGTGLGLPITHGIIKDHGGEITVKSMLGIGTTFTLILPIKQ